MSGTLLLDDDVDISRGDMIAGRTTGPALPGHRWRWSAGCRRDAKLARRSGWWSSNHAHGEAIVTDLHYRIDVKHPAPGRGPATGLG